MPDSNCASETPIRIAAELRKAWWLRLLLVVVAAVVCAVDYALASAKLSLAQRLPFVVPVFLWLGWQCHWNRASLGLRLTPRQGFRPWLRWTAAIGVGVGLACAAYVAWFPSYMQELAKSAWGVRANPLERVLFACVYAPLGEEAIYRLVLCVLLVGALGKWPAIVVNGLMFAGLHAMYGNLGPDNAVAGFSFAWAFLKSESIAIPIGLHALGNLVAFGLQLAAAQHLGVGG
jgi:CAAX protease family protein